MRIRFKGFASASAVAIAAAQSTGGSGSASVQAWRVADSRAAGPHAGSVTVSVRKSALGIAPESATFEITGYAGFDTPAPQGVYDARFHDIVCLWNFGDPGARHDVPLHLPEAHRDANLGYGPAVAHVYRAPGAYTVSVLVIELTSGKTAYWSDTIEVKDPDTEFADRRTIHVDDEGLHAGAPPFAATALTLADALDAVKAQPDIRRVMLRHDRVHALAAEYSFRTENDPGAAWRNVYVCSDDPAAQAVIRWTGATAGSAMFDFTRTMDRWNADDRLDFLWTNIAFEGPWDSTTETGLSGALQGFYMIDTAASRPPGQGNPDHVLFHGCRFSGIGLPLYTDGNVETFILSDTRITDWMDYGVFGYGDTMWFLGSEIAQNPDAMSGGRKDFRHNMHGPIRISSARLTAMDGCDLFSRNGWFQNVAGYTTIQPCMRWNMESLEGARLNLQRSVMEGGFNVLAISRTNGNRPGVQVNALVEKSLFLGSHMTMELVTVTHSGVTIRNNLFLQPDVRRVNGIYDPRRFIGLDGDATTDKSGPMTVTFNTFVNLMTDANAASGSAASLLLEDPVGFPAVTLGDNLMHQPALGVAASDFDALATLPLFAPREKGFRRRREEFTGPLAADVGPGQSFVIPFAEGDASWYVDGATGWHDLRVSAVPAGQTADAIFTFGAGGITVINGGAATWPAGETYTAWVERRAARAFAFDTTLATPPGTAALYAPALGSALLGAAANTEIEVDLLGRERPVYPTPGALEALP